MDFVIVESPTKAKTIGKFLGAGFKVESSYGHIRDLPKSKIGVDLERDFEPQYIIPVKAKKRAGELKKEAAKASRIILATDEDREGEAIAWHLLSVLGVPEEKTERIVFHEITESAIQKALKNPRRINLDLVDAQQARRILDRIVGYKLSPFLWKKVMSRLSAGRVQSAALRLIVEREGEIKKFIAEEYFTVRGVFESESGDIEAGLIKIDGKAISKPGIKSREEVETVLETARSAAFSVLKTEKKVVRKSPFPPFTTSTLQQEAFKRLRYSAKQTMRTAQSLYENGFITYMRTDSVNLSEESLAGAKKWILSELGEKYASRSPRKFTTKSKLAQEAHEAVRPTNPSLSPEKFDASSPQEKKLYELIWRRFIACQLPEAEFAVSRTEIIGEHGQKTLIFSASGNALVFDGFLNIWPSKTEDKSIPDLSEKESLVLKKADSENHFTEPPTRYNEASLVKALEEYGIGRPSTYAPIISVIQDRNYVTKNEARRFEPTEIGTLVNKVLTENFPEIVDIEFTAKMENDFDEIAEGKKKWQKVIRDFYEPFIKNLENKYETVEKQKPAEEMTEEICEKCGKPMVIKYGRFGKFLACSGFPECKNAKALPKPALTDEKGEILKCPKCGEGNIERKRTKKGGRFFYGCSKYPACDYASWTKPTTEKQEKK